MEEKLINNPAVKKLAKALVKLKTEQEATQFLRDLCTVSEIQAFAERLEVAQKIDEGLSYRKINSLTGVSTATITRVAHWLHHGMGGYQLVLKRMKS